MSIAQLLKKLRAPRQTPSLLQVNDRSGLPPIWPEGAQCAVSLTYDDALPCHLSIVAPSLEASGLCATFYVHVVASGFLQNSAEWTKLAARGHELGNHTVFHPCRNDPHTDPGLNLRDYTERRWRNEIAVANWILRQIDGRTERTFGNTCFDNWLGAGQNKICLETLAPHYFVAARGEQKPKPVSIRSVNLYNLGTQCGDGRKFEQLKAEIEGVAKSGDWLILTFHGIGKGTHSMHLAVEDHQLLVDWLAQNRKVIWPAPVIDVVKHLRQQKQNTR